VAGCLFRAVGLMCQALHGHDGRWLLNEKGMVATAGALTSAPPGLPTRHNLCSARSEPTKRTYSERSPRRNA